MKQVFSSEGFTRQNFRKRENLGGFTLVELIVVIAISAIMAGIIVAYSQTGRGRTALYVEESKVANYILTARSLTITTKRARITFPCGYGVRFDYSATPGVYYLFSYSTTTTYTALNNPCDNIGSISYSGSDPGYADVSSSTLPVNVVFASGPNQIAMVFFTPPLPATQMWTTDGPTISDKGYIYMGTSDGTASSIVSVTSAGQVNFY